MATKESHLIKSSVVATIIVTAFAYLLFKNFFGGFNIFEPRHWAKLYDRWETGWIFSTPREYAFITSILLYPIVLVVASWFLNKKFCEPKKEKVKKVDQKQLDRQRKKMERDLLKKKSAQPAKAKIPTNLSNLRGIGGAAQSNNSATTQHQETNTSANKAPVSEQSPLDLWSKLSDDMEKQGIFVLKEMSVAGISVNLTVVTQSNVFFILSGPTKGSVWETFDEFSPSVWVTETSERIPSPIQKMVELKNAFSNFLKSRNNKFSNLEVGCCMLLDHGEIKNIPEMLSYIEKVDVSVLRMGNCKSMDLPDSNALIEYIKSLPQSDQETNDAVAIAILDMMEA